MSRDAGPRKDEATGKWSFVVDGPPGPNGERRQLRRRGFATRKAAQEELDRLRVKVRDNVYVAPKRQTLAAFLADDWLPAQRARLEQSTLESYERNIRLHITPALGGRQLQALDPAYLNRFYSDLLEDGRKDGKLGGLSSRTVRYIATILHSALDDAVRWGRVATNVADRADPPSASAARAPEMLFWTRQELRHFLDLMNGDRYRPPFLFLATTGCRRGEVLGLRWSDLDLEAGRASIRQTVTLIRHRIRIASRTKKGKGRMIELDVETVACLRSWRARQAQERLALGAGYQENDLVFCHPDGRPYNPDRFSREFDRRIERWNLRRIRVHDLRHTWAVLALTAGVHIKVVSERLGHSSIAITADTYSHVLPEMQADAAEKVAGLIFGGGA